APSEGASLGALETGEVDAALRERLQLLHWIIAANDPDELHRRQLARGGREEGRRSAEHVIGFPEGRLDGIEGDGADYEDRHEISRGVSGGTGSSIGKACAFGH